MRPGREQPQKRSAGPGLGDALGHGLTWAVSTLVFLLLGSVLDGWLGTRPVFTVVLALVGAAGGFYSMYLHLVVEPDQRAREKRESRRTGGKGDHTD